MYLNNIFLLCIKRFLYVSLQVSNKLNSLNLIPINTKVIDRNIEDF